MIARTLAMVVATGLSGCAASLPPPAAAVPSTQAVVPRPISLSTGSNQAAVLFEESIAAAAAGDEASASAKLRAALELDPSFALAHAALTSGGPEAEAAAHLEQARKSSEALPKLERLWVEALSASEPELPAALTVLAAEHVDDWRILYTIGEKALYGTLDKRMAREAFERVVVLCHECSGARDALAYLYAEDARWSDALAMAEQQVALTPQRGAALETLAEVQLMAGRLDAAERSFRRVLELDPTSSSAYEGLASVAFSRDQWPAGIEILRQAAAAMTDPNRQSELRQVLIWALVAESRIDEAHKVFEETTSAGDAKADLKRSLLDLQIAFELGRWSEAETIAASLTEQARAVAPRLVLRVLGLRPVIASRLGKLPEAESLLTQLEAQSADAKHAYQKKELYMARGELAMAQSHTDAAIADFNNKWTLNHCSLQDPGRTLGRPGFEHYALQGQLLAAEALQRAGRLQDATARLTALSQLNRRGVGAGAVLRRARLLLGKIPPR